MVARVLVYGHSKIWCPDTLARTLALANSRSFHSLSVTCEAPQKLDLRLGNGGKPHILLNGAHSIFYSDTGFYIYIP